MSYLKPCYIHKHPGSDRRFVLDHLWQAINHSAVEPGKQLKHVNADVLAFKTGIRACKHGP